MPSATGHNGADYVGNGAAPERSCMDLSSGKLLEEKSLFQEKLSQEFKPSGSNEFSESALFLLDPYRVDNRNNPITIFVSIFDKMSVQQREVISRFEAAIALAGVEFGRIDLAIGKAEEMQKEVEALTKELAQMQKNFTLTTDKIRQRGNLDIMLNHLKPYIYAIFGAILTLSVVFIGFHLRIS